MGKNNAYKERQRARYASTNNDVDGEAPPPGSQQPNDGFTDVSFHSAEWHAARIAALQTERPSFDDWKKKLAEKQANEVDHEQMTREYRAQLDREREKLLQKRQRMQEDSEDEKKTKKRKRRDRDRDKKDRKKSKTKKSKKESKEKRRKDRDKDKKKKRKASSSSESDGGSSDTDSSGPVRLSEFFKG